MTLSLDDVRNKRFRMARKSGYEVLEVDEFVDEVEEAFAQMIEENQNLTKQVDSLKSGPATVSRPAAPSAQPGPTNVVPAEPQKIVVTTGKEASKAVVRLVEMSTEQAERLLDEATEDANRIREEANRAAHQVTTDARTRAERVESEARITAERLQADAAGRSQTLDRDIDSRRTEMFSELETQRDALNSAVQHLRSFEAEYRSNLTSHLRSQIETVEAGDAEPSNPPEGLPASPPAAAEAPRQPDSNGGKPEGAEQQDRDDATTLGGGGPTSDTPRLDALLGDQR